MTTLFPQNIINLRQIDKKKDKSCVYCVAYNEFVIGTFKFFKN